MLDMTHSPVPPTLKKIHERSVRMKNLMVAADQLGMAFLTAESGPLVALLEIALREAREMDAMIDELVEAAPIT